MRYLLTLSFCLRSFRAFFCCLSRSSWLVRPEQNSQFINCRVYLAQTERSNTLWLHLMDRTLYRPWTISTYLFINSGRKYCRWRKNGKFFFKLHERIQFLTNTNEFINSPNFLSLHQFCQNQARMVWWENGKYEWKNHLRNVAQM